MVVGDGLGVFGDGEAQRQLGLGVRLDGDWVWVSEALLGFRFRKITSKWVFVKFLIYILKLLVTKLFSSL